MSSSTAAAEDEQRRRLSKLFRFSAVAEEGEQGRQYYSAGGGELVRERSLRGILRTHFRYMKEEHNRPHIDPIGVVSFDAHWAPADWLEYKDVNIDGSPRTAEQSAEPTLWMNKYKREFDIAAAVHAVRRERYVEQRHDVANYWSRLRRRLGLVPPRDEDGVRRAAIAAADKQQQQQQQQQQREKKEGEGSDARKSGEEEGHVFGTLVTNTGPKAMEMPTLLTPWKVLLETIETGKPLTRVAKEYKPRIDFYGLDAFLDSAPSVVWHGTKIGLILGFCHGTVRAIQTINVDWRYLNASRLGVVGVINVCVLTSMLKWAGNLALLSTAFCLGDRGTRWAKGRILPSHDARQRSPANYVVGVGCAGATCGLMPWWLLNDLHLAGRMAVSGLFVGALVGAGLSYALERLITGDLVRLDATSRQLRRYEALLLREREWVEQERARRGITQRVWW